MFDFRLDLERCSSRARVKNYSINVVGNCEIILLLTLLDGRNNCGIVNLQIRRRFAYTRRAIFTRYCRPNVRHKATFSFYEGHAC